MQMHVPLGVHVHMRICLCTHTHIIGRPNCIPTCTVVGALCGDPPPKNTNGSVQWTLPRETYLHLRQMFAACPTGRVCPELPATGVGWAPRLPFHQNIGFRFDARGCPPPAGAPDSTPLGGVMHRNSPWRRRAPARPWCWRRSSGSVSPPPPGPTSGAVAATPATLPTPTPLVVRPQAGISFSSDFFFDFFFQHLKIFHFKGFCGVLFQCILVKGSSGSRTVLCPG